MSLKAITLCAVVLTAMLGCKSDDPEKKGHLSLAVTDAPVDSAEAVVVQFTGVEIQGQGERVDIDFDAPKTIDLLALTGSDSEVLLANQELNAGQYQWMRLKVEAQPGVTDSYIDIEGARYSLYVPSGDQTGLKLNRPFVIAAGGRTDFTLDFDLRKSVHQPMNAQQDYILRPTIRVVDNIQVGHINGVVAESLLMGENCTDSSAVYLFDGLDATADDVDGIDPEPVTSSLIEVNEQGLYGYEIGFVEAGDYTLALTCQAANDDPATDDAIEFIAQQNVTVAANGVVSVDFNE